MRRIGLILVALLLAALGAALALADAPGEHEVVAAACNTSSTPDRTIRLDTTDVATVPGAVATVCVTATATATDQTVTGPTTTVTTASPPPPPPASVAHRWYSDSSAWSKPIPAGTPAAANSASMIAAMQNTYCPGFGCFAPTDFYGTPSAWIASNATPMATVEIDSGTCHSSEARVPIPAGVSAGPSGNPESVMGIYQADTGEEWDLYYINPPNVTPRVIDVPGGCKADSNWQAEIVAHYNPGWTGNGQVGPEAPRASNTPFGSGLLRPRDWQQPIGATWDHALAFAYEGNLRGSYVYPATATDGQCSNASNCPPMGARFQLDPSVNCSTWPSLTSEFVRQMCRTLQKYGAIIVDSGSGIVTENQVSGQSSNANADPPHNGKTAPWNISPYIQYLPQDLVAKLRVIDWKVWTGA